MDGSLTVNDGGKLLVRENQQISFIIGNGFNYLINDIVRNYPVSPFSPWPSNIRSTKDSIISEIGKITSLWKKFDELFEELKEKNPQYDAEELIRMIYSVIDFLSNIDTFQKILSPTLINEIKKSFEFLLIDRIRDIAKEFSYHESSQGYKDLKKLFPNFGKDFEEILKKYSVNQCDYFTTNYDGILDTLLTLPDYKYLANDGFQRSSMPDYYELNDLSLRSSKIRGLHIHGSYKFEKLQGDTYKIGKSIENSEPVMIFNNPQFKGDLVRKDTVLNQYFYTLSNSLRNSDKLIIFGNSMKNEPHIKKAINSFFTGVDKKLFICSDKPDAVKKELTRYFSGKPIECPTNGVSNMNDLFQVFEFILAH